MPTKWRFGSAKGVLFITIEDEIGVAQGILWPDRFEIYRRQIMSASMIAMRGRLQKEGEVIHIICDRIVAHDDMLRSISRSDFAVALGRADGATYGGGPDPRDPGFPGRTLSYPHSVMNRRPKKLCGSGAMIFIDQPLVTPIATMVRLALNIAKRCRTLSFPFPHSTDLQGHWRALADLNPFTRSRAMLISSTSVQAYWSFPS